MKTKLKTLTLGIFSAVFLAVSCFIVPTFADSTFSVSPMNQKIVLNPGEAYEGSFSITNPNSSTTDFDYVVNVVPFYVNDNYEAVFENNGDYSQIVDWIHLYTEEGTISPNQTQDIRFRVDVPDDAAAGGQYASITVTSKDANSASGTLNIQTKLSIAHILYAEVAGTTTRKGEFLSINVPGFLFSGNIGGTSTIKNVGNVHGNATYKLQVFPLFSDEEVYTNEENPESKIILPDRALTNTTYWFESPTMGIYNVVYTAEFEGVTSQVKKMVIVCPMWLLFVIIAVFILLAIWIVTKNKKRKS